MSYTGQPFKRLEDPRLVTGQGSYVDDIQLPGMLHAAVLRSPVAHARIRSIDVSAALELPGVISVVVGDEIKGVLKDVPAGRALYEHIVDELRAPEHPVLATEKVVYVGQPVAFVVAQDPQFRTRRLAHGEGGIRATPACCRPPRGAPRGCNAHTRRAGH